MEHEVMPSGDAKRSGQELATLHIRHELPVRATRDAVWSILTLRVDDWWRHPYRIQEGDGKMRLKLVPHGILSEHWGESGFASWGQVSLIDPGHTLELTGPCGMGAVHGVFSFHLEDQDDGVRLTLTHDAFGAIRDGVQGDYEEVWRLMLGRLKELAEGEFAYGANARTI